MLTCAWNRLFTLGIHVDILYANFESLSDIKSRCLFPIHTDGKLKE
jgi:hypothetical protein